MQTDTECVTVNRAYLNTAVLFLSVEAMTKFQTNVLLQINYEKNVRILKKN